ncbi:SAM-dependent methyltransferase [Thermodesulfobacteriota bacterium]
MTVARAERSLVLPPVEFAIQRQEARNRFILYEAIIEDLSLSRGMTILDIGSGPGYASFLFAEKLQGSGAVFATDIREEFIRYMAEEAKKRGLFNLFPVLVRPDGFDDFYGEHRYDLVFMCNVYHVIDNRIEYFATLRKFLKPGARLVVVIYNQAPLFSVDDLADLDGLIKALSTEEEDPLSPPYMSVAPFLRNLSSATRQLLQDNNDRNTIANGLVGDFNTMLQSPDFYKNFYRNSYFTKKMFSPAERDLANWLLMTLKEEGVLQRPVDRIDAKGMRLVIRLNRLFFQQRLGNFLDKEGRGAYLPAGDASRNTSKYEMFQEFNAAGYKKVDEIKRSPYFDAVILVPTVP